VNFYPDTFAFLVIKLSITDTIIFLSLANIVITIITFFRHTMQKILWLFILTSFLACARKTSYIVRTDEKNSNISDDIGSTNPEVLKIIKPYKDKVDGRMKEIIGDLTGELVKANPNSSLSNFMGDAMYEYTKTKYPEAKIDGALMNYGGVRLPSVPKGPISVTTIFELMPFDNTLVIMKFDKASAKKLFDRIAEYGGWPISSSIKIYGDSTQAQTILINDRNLNDLDSITLALPSYVAEGGDNNSFLVRMPKEDKGIFIREMLEAYVRSKKTIIPNNEIRIILQNESK
jgi:2',3'-cyclic-nucleotide 2'-phosphodiesterase (5'-nucleotidase family)